MKIAIGNDHAAVEMKNEIMTLLHLGDILSKGDIKECREYYQEDPGEAPDLATVVQEMERLLDVVTDGTYSTLLSDRWSEADSVWTQYSMEFRSILNNLDNNFVSYWS